MDAQWIASPDPRFRFFDQLDPWRESLSSSVDLDDEHLVTIDQAMEPLLGVIEELRSVMEIVKRRCEANTGALSVDEAAAIMLYTIEWTPNENSLHFILNRKLQEPESDELLPWYSYLKLLQTAVNKLPGASRRIFYRGTNAKLTQRYSDSQIFYWHGFLSADTSLERLGDDPVHFGQTGPRTLLVIHTDHGKDITPYSFYPGTKEIFLPFDQQYQVISNHLSKGDLRILTISDTIQWLAPVEKPVIVNPFPFLRALKKYEIYCEINFRGKGLTDDQMQFITQNAIFAKQCRWLSLQYNRITSAGLTILADELSEDVELESLHLSGNQIDDANIDYWSDILFQRCYRLTFLSLDQNSIGDEGAQCLAKILTTNETLTDLWLSKNKIGNRGVRALATAVALDNKTLLQLYLDRNPLIDDDSMVWLTAILKLNRSLVTFYIQDCSLTSASQASLEHDAKKKENFDLFV